MSHRPLPALCARSRQRRCLMQWAAMGAVLPTWAAHAQAQQMALSAAINVSGSLRALSQRVAKAYCQQFLQVMPDAARDVLNKARQRSQAAMIELTKGAATGGWPADISRQFESIQQQFSVLYSLTATEPSKAGAVAASEQADRILAAAQKATDALETQAKASGAKLVNMAGRQRMLSQRIAKSYFLLAITPESKVLQTQMTTDAGEFKRALQALGSAPVSTETIRAELELGKAQWLFFETALRRSPDAQGMDEMATTSERLLAVMERLTSLYDTALREIL